MKYSVVPALACWLILLSPLPTMAEMSLRVSYHDSDDTISLAAVDAPLSSVLAQIAGHAKLDVFMAPSIRDARVNLTRQQIKLEKALALLLRPYDYAASFKNVHGQSVLNTIKIYEKGHRGGALTKIAPTGQPTAGPRPDSGGDLSRGGPKQQLVDNKTYTVPRSPTDTPAEVANPSRIPRSLAPIQAQLQAQELAVYQEQQILDQQAATTDPTVDDTALILAADKTMELEQLKTRNKNLLESMQRIERLQEELNSQSPSQGQ